MERKDCGLSKEAPDLKDRQQQFAVLIGINPEYIKGLEFCNHCGGLDCEWTDWSGCEIDVQGLDIESVEQAIDYREYLSSLRCKFCDGTGFEGGSFKMSNKDWIVMGSVKI
jgi:hypothetical protein